MRAGELVGKPIHWRDMRLGRVTDILFDPAARHAMGLEVVSTHAARFLPFAAVRYEKQSLSVSSPLSLLDHTLPYYREHGLALSSLVGVERPDDVADVLLLADGTVERMLLRARDEV